MGDGFGEFWEGPKRRGFKMGSSHPSPSLPRWTLPAQWTLATPSGHAPFSHWLQRWRSAALTLQAMPTPLLATPTPLLAVATLEEGEGQEKAPPPKGH